MRCTLNSEFLHICYDTCLLILRFTIHACFMLILWFTLFTVLSRDTLTNVRLDVRERIKVRASVCLVVRFLSLGCSFIRKEKHKKKTIHVCHGLACSVSIHVHLHSYSCC